MACPTCDHTMQNIGADNRRVFWCPRCGTLKEESSDYVQVEQPIWIRHVVHTAELMPPDRNRYQQAFVAIRCMVERHGLDEPRVSIELEKKHDF